MNLDLPNLFDLLNTVVGHPGYQRLEATLRHDLQNYLMIVRESLALERAYPGEGPALSIEQLNRIRDYTRRLQIQLEGESHLVETAPGGTSLEVGEVLHNLWPLLRSSMPPCIQLHFKVEPHLWIRGTSIDLDRILINLILNARNAIRWRGSIHVHAARHTAPGGTQWVGIRVCDDGQGMSAARLAQVQSAFPSGNADGHGVGLHSSRNLATAMGGELSLQSRKGVGTQALVRFPCLVEPSPGCLEAQGRLELV